MVLDVDTWTKIIEGIFNLSILDIKLFIELRFYTGKLLKQYSSVTLTV